MNLGSGEFDCNNVVKKFDEYASSTKFVSRNRATAFGGDSISIGKSIWKRTNYWNFPRLYVGFVFIHKVSQKNVSKGGDEFIDVLQEGGCRGHSFKKIYRISMY